MHSVSLKLVTQARISKILTSYQMAATSKSGTELDETYTQEKDKMSALVLELRPYEVIIINGAPVSFRTKSRIELTAKARFLFGKQIIAPDQANTPARRIYFALQSAYIGTPEEQARWFEAARNLVAAFKEATTSNLARQILDQALAAAEDDECYRALKLVRRIIQHEDVVLGTMSSASGQRPVTQQAA